MISKISFLCLALFIGTVTAQCNETCTGQWTEWSACFPGTSSDTLGFMERVFNMTPASANSNCSCAVTNSVWETQTQPCNNYTDDVIPDLSVSMNLSDCSGMFHCANGRCINPLYKCNGDDDCGDASDEYPIRSECALNMGKYVCGLNQEPGTGSATPIGERFLTGIPGIEEYGAGFDILTGEFRSDVLSMSPHGSCRRSLISGMTDTYYRIPKNIASYRQIYDVVMSPVAVLGSSADVLNYTQNALMYNLNFGGSLLDLTGLTGLTQSSLTQSMVKYEISTTNERAYARQTTFVSTAEATLINPSDIELSTAFISQVMKLPYNEFSYSQYMGLVREYGTHYVSEGKLGGEYQEAYIYSRCFLDGDTYKDYSSQAWQTNLGDCTRQSFYYNLSPNTSSFTSNCQSKTATTTTTFLQDEAVDKSVLVRGGSISTASDLKFSFSKSTWDAWVQTIPNGQVLNTNQFRLQRISKLMSSKSIPFSNRTRQQNVANFIDQAIDDFIARTGVKVSRNAVKIYLKAYDAQSVCEPCPVIEDDDLNAKGVFDTFQYEGLGYVTGTSSDYKCYCAYGNSLPTDELTCDATMPTSVVIFTVISCIVTALNTYMW